jgi:hypothetical protein
MQSTSGGGPGAFRGQRWSRLFRVVFWPLMLGYQRWIQATTRGRPHRPPSSVPHRQVAGLVQRLMHLISAAHVDQVLETVIFSDQTFAEQMLALAEVLQAEATSERGLPEQATILLVDLSRLALAVDQATAAAEDAEMMGTASPFQSTLRMRATAARGQDGPPPEVTALITAYQKVPLALLLLVYLKNQQTDAPETLLVELARVVRQGHLARLAHLAALGYEVPEELIPSAGRLDMETLYMKREPHPRQGGLFATPLEEPDFEALEHATRAALQQQGQDADDVLRRAAENVRRAGESRELPTEEVLRRATDWVLGQA